MKMLFLITMLSLSSLAIASDCNERQALFKGTVINLESYQDDYAQIGACSFKLRISLSDFHPDNSTGCGPGYQEVANTTFSYDFYSHPDVLSCPVSYDGQVISGRLIKKNGIISID